MKRYLKLTNFELNRFFKIYLVLIVTTLLVQTLGVVLKATSYMNDVKEQIATGGTVDVDFGLFSFAVISKTLWFNGPIALCIVSLLIYVFFIWYRDWFGKNTFIYRLLMLPTARINVFFAKATAIFLMVLGLVSLQLVFLLIESEILKLIVPATYREDLSTNQIIIGFDYLRVLYPTSFIQFVINYGIGFMAVIVIFTAILMERSFRWKGIVLGILFTGLALFVFSLPVLLQTTILEEFFYPTEMFILMVITWLIVIAGSIWVSNYLLNRKIRV